MDNAFIKSYENIKSLIIYAYAIFFVCRHYNPYLIKPVYEIISVCFVHDFVINVIG